MTHKMEKLVVMHNSHRLRERVKPENMQSPST